jgi:K+-sensing histidine kinase KdpD
MYFVVALVNGVLTFQIRKGQKEIQHHEKKQNTLKFYNTLLNSLSHELRTPIATIIGASDNLIRNRKNRRIIHLKEMFKVNQVTIMVLIMTKKINRNKLLSSNKPTLEIY